MNVGSVADLLVRRLREDRERYGLARDRVEATYVLNPGGFVTANFRVTDGARAVHVKISFAEEDKAKLRRWESVGDLLTRRYAAPAVLGWIDLGEGAGLVFEGLDGAVRHDEVPEPQLTAVLSTARELHRDRELAALLGPARPMRESFIEYFVRICETDLSENEVLPPFVDDATRAWMEEEVAALRAACEASPAFDGFVDTPIHGDLWPGNVLIAPDGSWRILDWDDLAIGDPVLDCALLTFGTTEGARSRELFPAEDEAFHQRFDLAIRGTMLIGVVDSLADWIEAAASPDLMEQVRATKQRDHEYCLDRYRARYG